MYFNIFIFKHIHCVFICIILGIYMYLNCTFRIESIFIFFFFLEGGKKSIFAKLLSKQLSIIFWKCINYQHTLFRCLFWGHFLNKLECTILLKNYILVSLYLLLLLPSISFSIQFIASFWNFQFELSLLLPPLLYHPF